LGSLFFRLSTRVSNEATGVTTLGEQPAINKHRKTEKNIAWFLRMAALSIDTSIVQQVTIATMQNVMWVLQGAWNIQTAISN
jgi:hypothetical protein